MARADRFLHACRRQAADCTPVWLMRQAGRYLPEFRALRQKYGLLEIIKTPELALEVTMLPVKAFELDAAIVFADILQALTGIGLQLDFLPEAGAVISNPIRSHADIESLAMPPAAEALDFSLKTIELLSRELNGLVPLIGSCGAPFSLACHAIEGSASKHYKKVKELMYSDRAWWQKLMDKLTLQAAGYLAAQAEAGAQALQLFDSRVGTLNPYAFREWVLPNLQRLINSVKDQHPEIPVIYFSTGTSGYLPLLRETGADVIGVDWRTDLPHAWEQLEYDVAIQGNLDPALLLGPDSGLKAQAARLLDAVGGRPGHIMNLGHGIFRETPPGNVAALIDFVHEYTRRAGSE